MKFSSSPSAPNRFLALAASLLLLVPAAAVLTAPSIVHAAALPYYPSAILPNPDGLADTSLAFIANNGQGYLLLKATPYPVGSTPSKPFYVVYKNGQYITLPPPTGAGNDQIIPVNISDTSAADNSFYVCGSLTGYADPHGSGAPEGTEVNNNAPAIAWHVNNDNTVTTIVLQGKILGPDSAFPYQEQSASPAAINSSGYAVGNTQSYLLYENAYWTLPGYTCYVDTNVPGYDGGNVGVDEAGNVVGYVNDGTYAYAFYRDSGGTVHILVKKGFYDAGGYNLNAFRNGRIGGSYQTPYDPNNGGTATARTPVVYDVTTGTSADLASVTPPFSTPGYLPSVEVTEINNFGDALGQVPYGYALWLRDRTAGTYAYYSFENDLLPTAPVGTGPDININTPPKTILGDGAVVVNTTAYTNPQTLAGQHQVLELLAPGADPRPAVTSAVQIGGNSYQSFSYQITATNNPTGFLAGHLSTGYDNTIAGLPTGVTLDPATGVISGTLPSAGTYIFEVAAGNGQGVGVLPVRVTLTITDRAGVPTVNNSDYSANGDLLEPFSYQVTATNNPTGYSASSLPPGLTLDTASGVISGQPTLAGSYSVIVQAVNAVGVSAPFYLGITIHEGKITSPLTAAATLNQPFSYQIMTQGIPATSALTYSAYGFPYGLTCDTSTGLISGTPNDNSTPGTFKATLYVYNQDGQSAAATLIITLGYAPTPTITSPAQATATTGQAFSYQITTSGFTPTTYSASSLPAGLSVNTATGLISGVPADNSAGSYYYVGLEADDNSGNRATGLVVISVVGPGTTNPPVITSVATATATVGQPFSYQITAANISPTYFIAYGLPDGLTVNNTTGLISGTPTAVFATTVYDIYLYVQDNGSHNTSGQLVLTLNPAGTVTPTPTPSPTPPGTTPTPTPTPTPVAGSDDLTIVTSVSPDPLVQNGLATYHVVVTNHGPAAATGVKVYVDYDTGLTFVAQGSAPVIQQTSTFLSVSLADLSASGTGASTSFDLIFRVTASGGKVACSTSVSGDQNDNNIFDNNEDLITTVNGGTPAAHAPTINAPAGGVITIGQAFSYQITTLGDVAVDTYGATGLPNGLALDAASGVITGTPTADAALGVASVTLSASNGAGRSTSTRMFTVVAAPTGKTSDVFATLSGLKVTKPAGDGTTGKYVFKGSATIANAGKKPAKKVAVGLYLSNSPYFSFPAVAGDPSLAQVAVFLDTSNPLKPTLSLTPAGSTVMTAVLPVTLSKKGVAGDKLGPVPFKLKIPAKRVNAAAAKYRYLLVVLDPANTLKESNKANNVVAIDLQQTQ